MPTREQPSSKVSKDRRRQQWDADGYSRTACPRSGVLRRWQAPVSKSGSLRMLEEAWISTVVSTCEASEPADWLDTLV